MRIWYKTLPADLNNRSVYFFNSLNNKSSKIHQTILTVPGDL